MKKLKIERKCIALDSDKNLGPVVMETQQAIVKANKEHLNNCDNHKPLTKQEAITQNQNDFNKIGMWFTDNVELPPEERTYFRDKLWGKRDHATKKIQPKEILQFPHFHTLPKLTKTLGRAGL